jgi:hypothetical protein
MDGIRTARRLNRRDRSGEDAGGKFAGNDLDRLRLGE